VFILLPPSEGKTAPRRGKPLDLASLTLPALAPARQRVLESLIGLCSSKDDLTARTALGLSPGQADEVARNTALRTAPTATAAQIYTGVLYEALDLATLSPAARKLMRRSLLVFSGLWGVVGIDDRIPAYRCAAGVSLPGVGGVGTFWRKALPAALAGLTGKRLVIDLRSGPYAAMWQPSGPHAAIRVLHERIVGGSVTRTVVSHFNKATKGRLVRDLATAGMVPRDLGELMAALHELKYTAERDGNRVDIVVSEL
jgi:cytoplasmic iron level regulating protein YaaA (DUF328/UPF0246 family)